tara:strand:- start:510 stop:1022 length:513 start_codon:yes stop_codon:yes gene_type:complete
MTEMQKIGLPRSYLFSDVELNWLKLVTPVTPFGIEQYEAQLATTDKAQADEWTANHFNVKEKVAGTYTVSLKRKASKMNGADNGKVRVVDHLKKTIDNPDSIGNGSRGNAIVFQYAYDKVMGKSGIASSLTAIQVTDLKIYSGENPIDFEVLEPQANSNTTIENSDILEF